ncbi:hypothetical protein ACS0TY_011528 [Phlomoides rotata]
MEGIEENGKAMAKNYKSLEAQFTQMSHQQRTTDFQLGQLAQTMGNMQTKESSLQPPNQTQKSIARLLNSRAG